MNRARLTASVAVLWIGRSVSAAAPPTTAPATHPADPAVAALIRQLDADDWQARDAAAEQLAARGEAVRPAVADAADHAASPEVRSRAAGVIARLNRASTDRPTTVTVHLANAAPEAVFAELTRQTGVGFQFWPARVAAGRGGAGRRATVAVDGRPFWAAVDDACRATGTSVTDLNLGDRGGRITITEQAGDPLLKGQTAGAGLATIVVRDDAAGPGRMALRNVGGGTGASIGVLALFDPKVRPADGTEPAVAVTAAADDRGGSLLPPVGGNPFGRRGGMAIVRRGGRVGFGFSSGLMYDLTVPLGTPTAGATRVAVLKATLSADVVDRTETVTVDDASHAGRVVRAAGPYQLTMRRCTIDEDGISYALSIAGPAVGAAGRPLPPPDIHLDDADGKPITGGGSRTGGTGIDGKYQLSVDLNPAGPVRTPVRLVCRFVTRTRPMAFPFELHDVPLPATP